MPWVCINCGWENENDERVGLEEPLCIRCRKPREDPDEVMNTLTTEINNLNEQMLRISRLARRIREKCEDLESEIAAINADLKEISAEYEGCKLLLKAAEDRQEVIQKNLWRERQLAPDQVDLTRFKLCA
jgi:chromosome segregation ATPase